LRPHVWRKRGIDKELHLVSNADAATQQSNTAKQIVVKLEHRCHDKTEIVSSTSPDAAQSFTIFAPTTPARAERFVTTPAILERTRDNAPHTAEG
jgi:hypothetical protein